MDLMEQAMRLKQSQVNMNRKMWNSWPAFLQNTLFHKDMETIRFSVSDVDTSDVDAFCGALEASLVASLRLRETGAQLFASGNVTDACFRFEESAGVFMHVVPLRPDWQSRGLVDDDLGLVRFDPTAVNEIARAAFGNEETRLRVKPLIDRVVNHLAAVLCNISVSAAKQGRWDVSAAAAKQVLDELDDTNLKAAHRLATALTAPTTCTAIHTDQAIAVLRTAIDRDATAQKTAGGTAAVPSEQGTAERAKQRAACADFLASLVQQRNADNAKGREMFGGMFDRDEWRAAPQQSGGNAADERTSSVGAAAKNPHDTAAGSDAAQFPAHIARAPIFRDTCQGWHVVEKMLDEAATKDSLGDTNEADITRARAIQMRTGLIDICALKIYTEILVPAMATSPSVLRFDLSDADPLGLRNSEPLSIGRSMLRLLGFDPERWNGACCGRGESSTKEALLFVALSAKCKDAYINTTVGKLKPGDIACYLVSSGAAQAGAVHALLDQDKKRGADAGGADAGGASKIASGEGRLRAMLSSMRDRMSVRM